jgi:hypothetical protein
MTCKLTSNVPGLVARERNPQAQNLLAHDTRPGTLIDLGVQPKQNSIRAPNQILTQQSNCQYQSDEKVKITEVGI